MRGRRPPSSLRDWALAGGRPMVFRLRWIGSASVSSRSEQRHESCLGLEQSGPGNRNVRPWRTADRMRRGFLRPRACDRHLSPREESFRGARRHEERRRSERADQRGSRRHAPRSSLGLPDAVRRLEPRWRAAAAHASVCGARRTPSTSRAAVGTRSFARVAAAALGWIRIGRGLERPLDHAGVGGQPDRRESSGGYAARG